jgi:hypothetical protein
MWKQRACGSPKAPLALPKQLPTPEVVEAIFHDFQVEFGMLEKMLIQARCKQAK